MQPMVKVKVIVEYGNQTTTTEHEYDDVPTVILVESTDGSWLRDDMKKDYTFWKSMFDAEFNVVP